MNYYLIDDKRENIRRIKEAIRRLAVKRGVESTFYWIDEKGNRKGIIEPIPQCNLVFPDPVPAELIHNIVQYSGDDNVFLIDLALNQKENDDAEEKYTKQATTVFTASIATQIIRALKEHDPLAKIKVLSRIWGTTVDPAIWQEPLHQIAGEKWFATVHFVPTIKVFEAHESNYSWNLFKQGD